MKFNSSAEVDVYVKHILDLSASSAATSTQTDLSTPSKLNSKKSYWPLIARLYWSTNDPAKSLKYAKEYLQLKPNDFEVNMLVAEIYESLNDEHALEYYEKAASEQPDPRGAEKRIARFCLKSGRVDFFCKGLYWLKKQLPWNENRFSQESLDLIEQLLNALLLHSSWTSDNELFDNFLVDLLDNHNEVYSKPSLHSAIIKCFLLAGHYQSAWSAVLESCFVLLNDPDWIGFICEHLDEFSANIDTIDAEDFLFFHDSLCRISITRAKESLGPSESEDIRLRLDSFQDILNTKTKKPIGVSEEEWSVLRMEYLARFHLYVGLWHFQQLQLPLQADTISKHSISKIITCLRLSLSFTDSDKIVEERGRKICENRISIARDTLIAILSCYNINWVEGNDVSPFKPSNEKPVKFQLPTLSEVYEKDGFEKLISPALIELNLDESLLFNPWNLSQFLWTSSWSFRTGGLRTLIRKLFPKIPEYSPVNAINSNEFSLTCANIECFLLQLCIIRHAQTIHRNRATTHGQALLLSHFNLWSVSEHQQAFWTSCLVLHGHPLLDQKSRYESKVLSKKCLVDYLGEIRGSRIVDGKLYDFYFLTAYAYYEMTHSHKIDRSVECFQFLQACKRIEAQRLKDISSSEGMRLFSIEEDDGTRIMERLLVELGSDVEKYEDLKEFELALSRESGTRHQQHLGETEIKSANQLKKNIQSTTSNQKQEQNAQTNENSMEEIGDVSIAEISMIEERPVYRSERSVRQFEKLKQLKQETLQYESPIKPLIELDDQHLSTPIIFQSSSPTSVVGKENNSNNNFHSVYEKLRLASLDEKSNVDSNTFFQNSHHVKSSPDSLPVSKIPVRSSGKSRINRQFEMLSKLK